MDCTAAHNLLSAWLDGELPPADRDRLEEHLEACSSCRAAADGLRQQDEELRLLFAPHQARSAAVADRVLTRLAFEPRQVQRSRRWLPLVASLTSAAAGFLVALLVFRPWEVVESPVRVVKELVQVEVPVERPVFVPALDLLATEAKPQVQLALGRVQMHSPEEKEWRFLQPGDALEDGARVRTVQDERCEFRCPDGSEVRLNGGTELYFYSDRKLALERGQVMLNVAKSESPFQVETADAYITGEATLFDLQCKPRETVLTVVQGQTRLEGRGKGKKEPQAEAIVKSGEMAKIIDGEVALKDRAYLLVQTTNWVNDLLVKKGRNNPELEQHLNGILAQLGNEKVRYLNEEEIRSLGDHCVLPLTRFVESREMKRSPEERRYAARILADLAQPWSIPDLIGLLNDDDGDVRYHAARALKRLTARDGALPAEEWKKRPLRECKPEYEIWKSWWDDNKYRVPKAP
jgi:ferric-dicitrate binding protein FerR (iron transport regulator)